MQPTFYFDGCAKGGASPTDINAVAPHKEARVLVISHWYIEFPARHLLCAVNKK